MLLPLTAEQVDGVPRQASSSAPRRATAPLPSPAVRCDGGHAPSMTQV